MNTKIINIAGWILFLISAIGFIMSSLGNFWAMFGSLFFLAGCVVFLMPYLSKEEGASKHSPKISKTRHNKTNC